MSDSSVNLTLDKALKGSGKLTLAFYIAKTSLEGDTTAYSCTLTTIDLEGKPVAEGMEFDLDPKNKDEAGFGKTKTNQIWTLGENSIEVGDDDDNTQTIEISEVILKSDSSETYSAKAAVNEGGNTVLCTENWKE